MGVLDLLQMFAHMGIDLAFARIRRRWPSDLYVPLSQVKALLQRVSIHFKRGK